MLDDNDRKWSVTEEMNNNKMLDMPVMLDETFTILTSSTQGRQWLNGIHNYDMLRNPRYANLFQYISPIYNDRKSMIKDEDSDDENNELQSDFVKIVLNLFFVDDPKEITLDNLVNKYESKADIVNIRSGIDS